MNRKQLKITYPKKKQENMIYTQKGKMINRDQPQADQVIGISRQGLIIAIIITTIDEKNRIVK